nr:heterodisulfide reductase subunit F [Desulfobacteraceae bacterium]
MQNPYLPYPVRIDEIITETEDKSLKTFKFVFINPDDEKKFAYESGQFGELSIPGLGELPIRIAPSPKKLGGIKFTALKS